MEIKEIIRLLYIRLNGLIKLEKTHHPYSEEAYYIAGQIEELQITIRMMEENA